MIELHNMDCMEYLATCQDNAFELAIVDPPYGIGEGGQRNRTGDRPTAKWKNPKSQIYKIFDDSKIPKQEYFDEIKRVSNNQIVWGGNYFSEKLNASKGWIVWNKKADIKEKLSMAELAWSSFDKKVNVYEHLWVGFKKKHKVKRIHPTQKPVELYEWLLMNYAKEGDRILDTHLGSGSIAIACHNLGFDLVGCELDTDYFNAAQKRLKQHESQLRIPML
jgi:site-specific DNA-methyltransferase (adenine-specific)